MKLTKDAKTVLYGLYKAYERRRKNGSSRGDAKEFGSASSVQEEFFPDRSLADIEDSLRELDRNDFLDAFYADNTVYLCSLSDYAISVMEAQTKETLLSIADFLGKFIP